MIGLLSLLIGVGTLASLVLIVTGGMLTDIVLSIVTVLIFGVLLVAYRRGWEYARYALLIYLVVSLAIQTDPHEASFIILVPACIALVVATPPWVIGSAVGTYIIMLIRGQFEGELAQPLVVMAYLLVIIVLVLGRLVVDTALKSAQENARQARAESDRAEQQAHDLAEANQLQEEQLARQRQLIELVETLEVTAVPLADGVLLAPLIGHLDTRRAQTLTSRLLADAHTYRAQLVILDIAGVTTVDTTVAQALLNTAQALRLLGCSVTLSGISAHVAATLVRLHVGMEGIATVRSPQEALARFYQEHTATSHAGNGRPAYQK